MSRIFDPITYKPFYPRVGRLRGRYVIARSGMLLVHWKWTFASMYHHPIVVMRFVVITLMSLLKRGVARVEEGRDLGLIHTGWTAGYYHWLTESLPRALVMQDAFPDAVPILPSPVFRKYAGSLERLGFPEVAFFPDGKNVSVCDPIVAECHPTYGTTDPALLKRVRDKILENVMVGGAAKPFRIVYVSRKKSRGRTVLNEDDVLQALSPLGVDVCHFEDLDFDGQVKLMQETRCLISIHGAGLTNMMFMPEGGSVIEIIPRKHGIFDYQHVRNSIRHEPCYVRLAPVFGHHHAAVLGTADTKWHAATDMANVQIDPAEIVAAVVAAVGPSDA